MQHDRGTGSPGLAWPGLAWPGLAWPGLCAGEAVVALAVAATTPKPAAAAAVAAAAAARRWNFFMTISYRLGRLAIDLTIQVEDGGKYSKHYSLPRRSPDG
jgi:hypothetical protein